MVNISPVTKRPERRKYAWMPYRLNGWATSSTLKTAMRKSYESLQAAFSASLCIGTAGNAKVERHSLAKAVLDLLDAK